MNFLVVALTVVFMGCVYAWPVLPLVVYPLNRRRGFWAALYCCAIAVFFGMEFRYSKFMIGTFFEIAVYTSAARAVAEASGVLEKPRAAWRGRA
ncbi:hypothetical protein ACFYRY_20785 [Streptomyces sp. NPDC005263]|uniref:hypothetical protein n=1 Tax=Streptomyces sp. NPDC005263 TaxID=3364711 RepID=UPI0036CFB947